MIYIITHKSIENKVNMEGYTYLYVGANALSDKKTNYYYDDEKINISKKNLNYCELTGMYWIWKNVNQEYVGLVHYRRFFTRNPFSENYKWYYKENELKEKLSKVDCLVAERLYVAQKNIREHYYTYHYKKDLISLEKIIKDKYSEYSEAFDKAFSLNYFYPCNMFFTRKKIFDEYCKWLFTILYDLEKVVNITEYDVAQSRIFGFISERLFNVWLIKSGYIIEELPIIQIDSSIKYRIRIRLDRIAKRAIREVKKY